MGWPFCHDTMSLFLIFLAVKSALSDTNMATLIFLCWYFHEVFFYPFTFNLPILLYLKWVSCRQHTVESCLLIQSTSLCLFTGLFGPFIFHVVIYILVLMSTILFFCFPFSCLHVGYLTVFKIPVWFIYSVFECISSYKLDCGVLSWFNIILGVFVTVVLNDINIWFGWQSKADWPSQYE